MTGFVLKLQIIAWSFHLSFFLVRSIIWTCWLSERDGRKNILGSKSILPDREEKDFTPDLTKLTKILVNLTPSFFLFIFFSFFPYKFFPRLCSRHRLRPSFEIFFEVGFFLVKVLAGPNASFDNATIASILGEIFCTACRTGIIFCFCQVNGEKPEARLKRDACATRGACKN